MKDIRMGYGVINLDGVLIMVKLHSVKVAPVSGRSKVALVSIHGAAASEVLSDEVRQAQLAKDAEYLLSTIDWDSTQ